ncbi:hypothetical protein HDU76_003973, partial [Blyttiomyces sp. JEL0837]
MSSASSTGLLAGVAVGLVAGVVGIGLVIWWCFNSAASWWKHRGVDRSSMALDAYDLAELRRKEAKRQAALQKTEGIFTRVGGGSGSGNGAKGSAQGSTSRSVEAGTAGGSASVGHVAFENGRVNNSRSVGGASASSGSMGSVPGSVPMPTEPVPPVPPVRRAVPANQQQQNPGAATNPVLSTFNALRTITVKNFYKPAGQSGNVEAGETWLQRNGWSGRPNANDDAASTTGSRQSVLPAPKPAYNELSVAALERYGLEVAPERRPKTVMDRSLDRNAKNGGGVAGQNQNN